ncbi:MAG: hypothetical protein PHF00_07190, partial [Elusimicrobia bacterium]|nr:hypothetical protein [Elusimicrobiota bacterium]
RAPPFDFPGSLTVSAWVKPETTTLPEGAAVVAKGNGGDEAFSLELGTSGGAKRYRFRVRVGAGTALAVANPAATAGQWRLVTGVYDQAAAQARVYIDGVLSATAAATGAHAANSHAVTVCNRQSGALAYDLGFSGAVDDVRLLSLALDDAQVAEFYRSHQPASYVPPGPNNGVLLTLPPNAFGAAADIFVSGDPLGHPLQVSNAALNDALARAPTGQVLIPGSLLEIVPKVGGSYYNGSLGSSANLSVPYNDADGDGLVDGASPPVAASQLRFYTLDPVVLGWDALPTTVDRAARRAAAVVSHFSIFALFGASTIGQALERVTAYPTPWLPGSSGRFDAPELSFANLPAAGSIRIFTLSGEKVAELAFSGPDAGTKRWDGRNDAGAPVASGVYFARIKSDLDGSTRILKLAIEK